MNSDYIDVKNSWEVKVPYIVHLKENSNVLINTNCKNEFCGYLVYFYSSHFYFELEGNRMFVVVPHNAIDWMGPNAVYFKANS